MGYAELISKLEILPRDKQAEVFDFVEFLTARCAPTTNTPPHAWTEGEFSRLSMQNALRGMEADTVSYTRDDLREHWQ
jgi:hypothetical protein